MKTQGLLAIVAIFSFGSFGLLGACSEEGKPDSPEVAAVKARCKAVLVHIVRVSPQMREQLAGKSEADAQKLAEARAAQLPVEELDQCTASEPEILTCMTAASDVAAIKKCIPAAEIMACMQRAKPLPDVRARCWTGDVKNAEEISKQLTDDVVACATRADKHPEIATQCLTNTHAADAIKP